MAALFGYHMWRVRKDGGLATPMNAGGAEDEHDESGLVVNAIPAVVMRVAVVTLATWLAVTVLAIAVPSPLEEAANPLVTPNPAKAPWYFLWLQEIVADTTVRLGPVSVNGALIGGVFCPAFLLVLATCGPGWTARRRAPWASGCRASAGPSCWCSRP